MNYNSSIQQSHYPQGELLAYGVLYAVGQDVGVGEVNDLSRPPTSKNGKSFSLISDFCSKSVSIINDLSDNRLLRNLFDAVLLGFFSVLRKATGFPAAF